ncbi:MAG: c-type cytochrome [Pseudomonadota bacterium]
MTRRSVARSVRNFSYLFTAVLFVYGGNVLHAREIDYYNGEEINELCAGCHGEYAQGGKEGEYPRLAGMPAAFIDKQMHLFRDRKRPNMPMLEYVDERQFPDDEIADISAYLSQLKLATKMSPLKEGPEFNAYERLEEAKRVINIARYPGDVEKGRKIYNKECRSCHGTDGVGNTEKAVPMLAGQYTNYLQRQVKKYLKGIRIHDEDDPEDELLAEFSHEELEAIFAFLSVADD